MSQSLQEMKDSSSTDERRLLSELMNHLLLTISLLGLIGIVLVIFRALQFGWHLRETLQVSLYCIFVAVTLARKRISLNTKVNVLILVGISIGSVGVLSLGMFAGGVFLMPVATILAAMIFSKKGQCIYAASVILVLVLAGIGFSTEQLHVGPTSELIHNPATWAIYTISFTILIVFLTISVNKYRSLTRTLMREVSLQRDKLSDRNQELEQAMTEIKTLQGIIPICSYCHNIRNDSGAWHRMEEYISAHSEAKFSHGICPNCINKAGVD